jgi:hypothetical protein
MVKGKTKKGTRVWMSYIPDCEDNTGGFYVEVYLNQYGDRYDYFCVHPEDCDCNNSEAVEKFIKEYVSQIKDY